MFSKPSIKIVFSIGILLFYSCSGNQLKTSLNYAGENRHELETVLKHYSQNPSDHLKLKAATYLLEHMDAHYYFSSPESDTYYRTLDSIFSLNSVYDEMSVIQDSLINQLVFPYNQINYSSYLQNITADLLIDNIDRAFESWQSMYAKDMNFEEFCEFLLPFKTDNEYPAPWRSVYYDSIAPYVAAFLNTEIKLDSGLIWKENHLAFNGKQYLTLPDSMFQDLSEFTVSTYVKPDEMLLYARVFDFGLDENYGLYFTPYAWEGNAMFHALSGQNDVIGIDTLTLSDFTHLSISYSNNFFHIYINSKLKKKVNHSIDLNKLVRNYIGKSQHKENPFFKGEIKDFRLYNRELNYTEIQSLAGLNHQVDTKELLQELVWKIRDLYHIIIVYESLMPGGYEPAQVLKMKKGNCYNYCLLGTYIFRSLGIPSAIDYTPQWANRSMGHSWNILYTGKDYGMQDYSFSALWDTIGQNKVAGDNKISKVFRMTYAKNPDSPIFNRKKDEVLPAFINPCIKDVTDLYFECVDVNVPLQYLPAKEQHRPYLCNFDNQKWVPVHWGEMKEKKARFENMGKDVVYLPAYFDKTGVVPAAPAFILTTEGEIKNLIPEPSVKQKLILTRKYHPINVAGKGELLLGGRFEVANKPDFSDSQVVYEVNTTPEIRYNQVSLNLTKPYRYFRYMAPEGSRGDISEIEIIGGLPIVTLTGKLIGNLNCPDDTKAENAFDNDPLTTYICNWGEQGCVGLDFGEPKRIIGFRYLPRNDANFIIEGEQYELLYWDNKWVTLGKQTGTFKQYLEYDDAPVNALFLLRNLTSGKEERIFTYENGEQVWW